MHFCHFSLRNGINEITINLKPLQGWEVAPNTDELLMLLGIIANVHNNLIFFTLYPVLGRALDARVATVTLGQL